MSWTGATTPTGWEQMARLERECAEATAAREPVVAIAKVEALQEALREREWEAILDLARRHCELGHRDDCDRWLSTLRDAGFWDLTRLREDEGFSRIRGEHKFQVLSRAIWANGYIAMLERPERERFQRVDLIFAALGLRTGEKVADVGAGSGYFTIPVAREVGPSGIVWAVDVVPEMLDYLSRRLRMEKLENVRMILAKRDDPMLPAGTIETIVMIDALHYVTDRVAFAAKLRHALVPRGRLVLIDYRPKPWEERPWGPPPEQQIPREKLDEEMVEAGFKVAEQFDFLPEQYFVIYRPR